MVFVCVKTVLRESEVLRPQISNGSLAMQAILKKIKTKLGTMYVCFFTFRQKWNAKISNNLV